MKIWLLSLLTILTLVSTNTLILVNNVHQDKVTITSSEEPILYASTIYDEVRNSSDYIAMKTNFKELQWHAENWGLSFVPIYGKIFYADFVKYYSQVVASMKIIMKKINLHNGWGIEQRSLLDKALGFSPFIFATEKEAATLKDLFWSGIEPTYKKIISLIPPIIVFPM